MRDNDFNIKIKELIHRTEDYYNNYAESSKSVIWDKVSTKRKNNTYLLYIRLLSAACIILLLSLGFFIRKYDLKDSIINEINLECTNLKNTLDKQYKQASKQKAIIENHSKKEIPQIVKTKYVVQYDTILKILIKTDTVIKEKIVFIEPPENIKENQPAAELIVDKSDKKTSNSDNNLILICNTPTEDENNKKNKFRIRFKTENQVDNGQSISFTTSLFE